MFPIRLGQLASLIGGRLIRGNPRTAIRHALYGGTRRLTSGVALFLDPGENVDRQLHHLREKASAGVIVPPGCQNRIPRRHPVIVVPHVGQALWKLVQWQRSRSRALFIGITGSSGKTTVKEMTAAVLMKRYRTLKSQANMNIARVLHRHLLRLDGRHQTAVLEMGMSRLGDIRQQCRFARPFIGIVTCVKEAHVGSLGNSLDNVVRAKQELVDGLSPGGLLILNADDPGSRKLDTRRHRRRILTFGIRQPATVRATRIRYTKSGMSFVAGGAPYQIPTWGVHNVYNALAAITAGRVLKVPVPAIRGALRTFPVPKMRLQRIRGRRGRLLINDAYNANPSAMAAGLHVLRQVSGRGVSVAVLGDMHELGNLSVQGHRQVGRVVARMRPSFLITVGPQATQIAVGATAAGFPKNRIRSFPNRPAAVAAFIDRNLPPRSIVYFKASRKMKLENLVKRLR